MKDKWGLYLHTIFTLSKGCEYKLCNVRVRCIVRISYKIIDFKMYNFREIISYLEDIQFMYLKSLKNY